MWRSFYSPYDSDRDIHSESGVSDVDSHSEPGVSDVDSHSKSYVSDYDLDDTHSRRRPESESALLLHHNLSNMTSIQKGQAAKIALLALAGGFYMGRKFAPKHSQRLQSPRQISRRSMSFLHPKGTYIREYLDL